MKTGGNGGSVRNVRSGGKTVNTQSPPMRAKNTGNGKSRVASNPTSGPRKLRSGGSC